MILGDRDGDGSRRDLCLLAIKLLLVGVYGRLSDGWGCNTEMLISAETLRVEGSCHLSGLKVAAAGVRGNGVEFVKFEAANALISMTLRRFEMGEGRHGGLWK